MSTYSFPRDDGDELQERPRGRAVPRIVEDEPTGLLIDIRVNGVTFGTVDAERLKARAQIDLERVRGALDLLRWCEQHAGVPREDLPRLEEELAEMPLRAVVELAQSISAALGEAVSVPKARRRP